MKGNASFTGFKLIPSASSLSLSFPDSEAALRLKTLRQAFPSRTLDMKTLDGLWILIVTIAVGGGVRA